MTDTPVNLSQALASFSDVYSPRIVGQVNDYDIRIAHVLGDYVWHVHDHTDEFFLVLDGQFDECDLTMRDLEAIERSVMKSLLAIYHGRIQYPSTAAITGTPVGPTATSAVRFGKNTFFWWDFPAAPPAHGFRWGRSGTTRGHASSFSI